MLKFSVDELKIQDKEAVRNTWYRSPKVSPNIIKNDRFIIRTTEEEVVIDKFEETVLFIIVTFKFLPLWIVQRWSYISKKNIEEVEKWVKVGLVWIETSVTGVYLRPTKFLLDLFRENCQYFDIPYNTLTHTISEAQVMFEIMTGSTTSELWSIIRKEKLLPCYHPLLQEVKEESGTVIIKETEFRTNFRQFNKNKLIEQEKLIESQIKARVQFTEEFSDFKLFPIVVFNTKANNKGEIYTQNPDLIIPIPRNNGKPQSIAIEVEISAKMPEKYDIILNSYRNNNKFGKVFYLCSSQRIGRLVREAYKRIETLGTCELYIIPFIPPSQDIENFSKKYQELQMELIKKSV